MPIEFYFVVGAVAVLIIAFFSLRGASKKHSERPWQEDVEQQQNWPE